MLFLNQNTTDLSLAVSSSYSHSQVACRAASYDETVTNTHMHTHKHTRTHVHAQAADISELSWCLLLFFHFLQTHNPIKTLHQQQLTLMAVDDKAIAVQLLLHTV